MFQNFQFMKVDGKAQLPDSLENAKFTSMAWTHDNKGLFYNVSYFNKPTDIIIYLKFIMTSATFLNFPIHGKPLPCNDPSTGS